MYAPGFLHSMVICMHSPYHIFRSLGLIGLDSARLFLWENTSFKAVGALAIGICPYLFIFNSFPSLQSAWVSTYWGMVVVANIRAFHSCGFPHWDQHSQGFGSSWLEVSIVFAFRNLFFSPFFFVYVLSLLQSSFWPAAVWCLLSWDA